MANYKALTIDNGGSELRIKPIEEDRRSMQKGFAYVQSLEGMSQQEADKDEIDKILKFPGPFYKINGSNFREKEVANKFHIINVLDAPNAEYLGYLGMGTSAQMYTGEEVELTSTEKKTESLAFYQRFIFGIALGIISDKDFQGIEEGWNLTEGRAAEINVDRLTTVYKPIIVTTLPIEEYAGDRDLPTKTKERLKGSYTVEFPLIKGKPVIHFEVEPSLIGILPEGGVVVSTMKSKLQPDEYSMLIDMGHVTIDLAIYLGNQPVGNYVESSKRAGSTLITRVMSRLADEGYGMNTAVAIQAINTGTIPKGKGVVDVSDIVRKVKDDFVTNYLKQDMTRLFNGTGILPSQIANIIPVGALLEENAKTGYMPYKIQEVGNMKDAEILKIEGRIRYANINAAYPFSKALLKAANKKAAGM